MSNARSCQQAVINAPQLSRDCRRLVTLDTWGACRSQGVIAWTRRSLRRAKPRAEFILHPSARSPNPFRPVRTGQIISACSRQRKEAGEKTAICREAQPTLRTVPFTGHFAATALFARRSRARHVRTDTQAAGKRFHAASPFGFAGCQTSSEVQFDDIGEVQRAPGYPRK